MRRSTFLTLVFIALLSATSHSQDITGLWKGTLYNDTTKKFYRYEIGISEEKGKLSGFSHTFFIAGDKEYYGVKKVKVKRTDGKIIIEDAGLIANNYPEAPARGVKQLNVLTLEIKDSIMTLSGPFTTNRTKEYSQLTGTVNLQRKNDFWQSALVPHLQELGVAKELSFVKKEMEETAKIEQEKAIAANNKIKEQQAQEARLKEQTAATVAAAEEQKTDQPAADTKAIAKNDAQPERQKESKKEIASTESKQEASKKAKAAESKTTVPETSTIAKTEEPRQDNVKKETSKQPIQEQEKIETKPLSETIAVNTKQESQPKATEPKQEIKPAILKPIAAAEVASRANVLQQTVYFSSDSLQIALYDNGEVDGDTVSVLMNGKIIMAREGLSTNAVRKTIYVGHETDSIELIMYAENLGAIAPNTGLLVVHDGKSIYEIRFSGDLKKNASIILRRRKSG